MGKKQKPELPLEIFNFYRKQLIRELSHMFEWTGLPQTVPKDYIEKTLVKYGRVLYYEDESIGQDVLRATVTGYNRHDEPTQARTYAPTTNQEVRTQITRNLRYLSDSEEVNNTFKPQTDGVLINNMEDGQTMWQIVDFFAERLARAQVAFDTNLLYANMPYIFQTSSEDTRLSIKKMFSAIYAGDEPYIIVDKELMMDNKDRTGIPTDIPFIGKELYDIKNEIMMDFKQTVGFKTAGVDKAERVNLEEVQSNDQHTKTVLQVMLEQRQKAVEAINQFFGQSIEVKLLGEEELEEQQEEVEDLEGGEEIGGSNDRVGSSTDDE